MVLAVNTRYSVSFTWRESGDRFLRITLLVVTVTVIHRCRIDISFSSLPPTRGEIDSQLIRLRPLQDRIEVTLAGNKKDSLEARFAQRKIVRCGEGKPKKRSILIDAVTAEDDGGYLGPT